jgi:hypothetical protein
LFVELPASVCLTVVVFAFLPLGAVALVAYLALESAKYLLGFEFALSSDAQLRRPSVPFANEMFYTLWLPLAASVQIAVTDIALWWLPIAHCLLFNQQAIVQWRDANAVVGQFRMRALQPKRRS